MTITQPAAQSSTMARPTEDEIARIAALSDRIEAAWLPNFPLHLEKLKLRYEPKIYLLLGAFPDLDPRDVERLSLALRLVLYATLLTDKLIDGAADDPEPARSLLRVQAMQFESYRLLYDLFPPTSPFWERYKALLASFSEACLEERRFAAGQQPWQDFDEKRALAVIRGKNGLARLLAVGLAALAGDEKEFSRLDEAIEKHYIAWQLWDDLCDWKEDFRDGVPSLLLSRVLDEPPPQESREAWIPHLARKIYYEGHARQTLEMALGFLDEADRAVEPIPELGWRGVMTDLRVQCVALRDDLDRIVEKNLRRARQQRPFELGEPPHAACDLFQDNAWSALVFLVDQWHLGFGEAQHVAQMAHALGYRGETEFPSGDVFQRALIADALCDADAWLAGRLQKLLDHEVGYLLSQRSESGIGGWRYFPSIPELAPDADDLGQVLQVLLRCGRRAEVEEYGAPPLEILLDDARRRGGPFSTWIIPEESRGEVEEIQARLRGENWGPGPDSEVMANLLYALALDGRKAHADVLELGLDHLEKRQAEDGSWESKWYFGPFYGTYVSLRLFACARPGSRAVAAARDFLLRDQRSDGGWGWREASDPLSTSLALLGLATVPSAAGSMAVPAVEAGDWAQRGVGYLDASREADGGWSAVPFISIPTYGSRTVTTLYALKACLASRPAVGRDKSEVGS
jgi:squalene-hopene/tetraprenyl-beta-curcumene cyclase